MTEKLEYFMWEALLEGRKALPNCLPNPPVGCVLVRDNEIVARGYTVERRQNAGDRRHLCVQMRIQTPPERRPLIATEVLNPYGRREDRSVLQCMRKW